MQMLQKVYAENICQSPCINTYELLSVACIENGAHLKPLTRHIANIRKTIVGGVSTQKASDNMRSYTLAILTFSVKTITQITQIRGACRLALTFTLPIKDAMAAGATNQSIDGIPSSPSSQLHLHAAPKLARAQT